MPGLRLCLHEGNIWRLLGYLSGNWGVFSSYNIARSLVTHEWTQGGNSFIFQDGNENNLTHHFSPCDAVRNTAPFPPSFKLLKQKNRTQVQRRACSAPSPFGALHGKEFWNTCWNLCAGKWFLLENNTIDTGEVDVGRRAMQVIPPGQLKIMWISHFWMWFTMYWDLSSVQNLYYLYLLNLVSLIIRISSLSKVFFGGLSYISTSRSF